MAPSTSLVSINFRSKKGRKQTLLYSYLGNNDCVTKKWHNHTRIMRLSVIKGYLGKPFADRWQLLSPRLKQPWRNCSHHLKVVIPRFKSKNYNALLAYTPIDYPSNPVSPIFQLTIFLTRFLLFL